MGLTIRILKSNPELDRGAARERAQATAEADGYQADRLGKATIRLERVGASSLQYVVEFPDATR